MPFRIGLVGCGRLAERGYLPALHAATGVELVAVADPDRRRRDLLAELGGGVRGFADAESLLEGSDVDGLVVASPVGRHLADAERGAAAAVAVLVEKPPAPDAENAARLVDLGPRVWVAFNRRFDPGVAAVRAAIPSSGALQLDLALHYRRASWGALQVSDDVILDLVPHLLDLARWLTTSRILDVRALELSPDRAELVLVLERGTVRIRARADALHDERVVVRDERLRLLARHRVGGLRGALVGRFRPTSPHPLAASLRAQLEAFAAAASGEPHDTLATAADGLAVMEAVEAALCSADDRGAPTPCGPTICRPTGRVPTEADAC